MSNGGKGRQNSDNLRTDDVVSTESGFGSRDSYRKAKYIADHADSETIEKLDAEEISIHRAYVETKKRLEKITKAIELRKEGRSYPQIAEWLAPRLGFKVKEMKIVELAKFDYEQLDGDTSEFLRKCEEEIEEILVDSSVKLGCILSKAQERLAKNGYGCFGAWLEFKGYPRRSAYEMVDIYKSFVRIPHNQRETFISLSISLQKAISAKSSESTPAKAHMSNLEMSVR